MAPLNPGRAGLLAHAWGRRARWAAFLAASALLVGMSVALWVNRGVQDVDPTTKVGPWPMELPVVDASVAWLPLTPDNVSRIELAGMVRLPTAYFPFRAAADGRVLATATGPLELWEVPTGRRIGTLVDRREQACCFNVGLTFSPGAELVAVTLPYPASPELPFTGALRVWDVRTGHRLEEVPPLKVASYPAFSPDGREIAVEVRGENKDRRNWSVQVFPLAGGGPARTVASGVDDWTGDVIFSRDWRYLLIKHGTGQDSRVQVWDVAAGRPVFEDFGGLSFRAQAAFSPDGGLVARVTADGRIEVRQTQTGRRVAPPLAADRDSVVAFSPDGSLLAGMGPAEATIWRVGSWTPVHRLAHQSSPEALAFSADGQLLATHSRGTTSFWSVADGAELGRVTQDTGGVQGAIQFAHEGRALAVRAGYAIAMWAVPSNAP